MWPHRPRMIWLILPLSFALLYFSLPLISFLNILNSNFKQVNSKGNQPWIFIGRTDAEAQILRPPDVKSLLIGKGPDAGKDWRHKEKGTTEDDMVGWHYQLKGHEFEQAPGDCERQGSQVWLQSVRHNLVTEYTHKSSNPLHCLVPFPESFSHSLILQISVQI